MDFFKSLSIATSGLKAQAGRMRVIAENIANADSLPKAPGEQPYRRKIPTFSNSFDRELDASILKIDKVKKDQSPFEKRYEPAIRRLMPMAMSRRRMSPASSRPWICARRSVPTRPISTW